MNILEILMDILYYPFQTKMLSFSTLANENPEIIKVF